MGTLIIPVDRTIPGPWLIDNENLEALHQIIQYAEEKLRESAIKNRNATGPFIGDSIIVTMDRIRKGPQNVIIYFGGGSNIVDDSIQSILQNQMLNLIKPDRIKIDIDFGFDDSLSITINGYGGVLDFSVRAFDQKIRDDITYKVDSWVEKNKPHWVAQFWSSRGIFLGFVAAVISLAFCLTQLSKAYTVVTYRDSTTMKEIREILSKGVSTQDQNKAMELLLKFETNYKAYSTVPKRTVITRTELYLFGTVLLLAILFPIRPTTVIGLGKNKSKVRRLKWYTKAVLISIPLAIVGALLDFFIQRSFGG